MDSRYPDSASTLRGGKGRGWYAYPAYESIWGCDDEDVSGDDDPSSEGFEGVDFEGFGDEDSRCEDEDDESEEIVFPGRFTKPENSIIESEADNPVILESPNLDNSSEPSIQSTVKNTNVSTPSEKSDSDSDNQLSLSGEVDTALLAYMQAFPYGHDIIPTPTTGLLCGFFAVKKSMTAMYPYLPCPTIGNLRKVMRSEEFVEYAEAFGMKNENNCKFISFISTLSPQDFFFGMEFANYDFLHSQRRPNRSHTLYLGYGTRT